MTIIDRIVQTLEDKGKTMAELSRSLGLNTSTTSNWKMRQTDPPASMIAPICEFLDVSFEYILTGSEKTTRLNAGDQDWLDLIHSLPEQAQQDFKGAMRLYRDLHATAPQEGLEERRMLQAK